MVPVLTFFEIASLKNVWMSQWQLCLWVH